MEEPTRAGSQSDWPVDYIHQSEADCEESSGAESRAETLEAAAGEDAKNAADAETSKKTECKADCWVVVNVSREVDESNVLYDGRLKKGKRVAVIGRRQLM